MMPAENTGHFALIAVDEHPDIVVARRARKNSSKRTGRQAVNITRMRLNSTRRPTTHGQDSLISAPDRPRNNFYPKDDQRVA